MTAFSEAALTKRDFQRFIVLNPLAVAAVAAVVGILVARFTRMPLSVWVLALTVGILVLVGVGKHPKWTIVGLVSVLSAGAYTWRYPGASVSLRATPQGSIVGKVVRDAAPDIVEPRSALVLWKSPARPIFGSLVRVRLPANTALLPPGAQVEFSGFVGEIAQPRNPGEIDRRAVLEERGIVGEFVVAAPNDVEFLAMSRFPPVGEALRQLSLQARSWTADALSTGLERFPERAAVVKAMVLGMNQEAKREDREAFELSGTMHLFAVSGLHIMIFALVATGVIRALPVRFLPVAAGTVLAAFAYAFVTGWPASATRAAVMVSVFQVGTVAGRGTPRFNSLGLAALAILAIDAGELFRVGFQLSFLVLMALTLFAGPMSSWLRGALTPDPFIPRKLFASWTQKVRVSGGLLLSSMIGVSLAAWAGSALPIWIYFRIVTPVTILANLVMIPAAYLVIALATTSVFSTLVGAKKIAAGANRANGVVVGVATRTAREFSELPAAYFRARGEGVADNDGMVVTIFEVPFGGGTQVIDPPGPANTWVLDCGSAHFCRTTLRRFLEEESPQQLAGLLLSHADAEHTGGASGFGQKWKPRVAAIPAWFKERPSPSVRDLMASGIYLRPLNAGEMIPLDGGGRATLEVLWPPPGLRFGIADDNCLVCRIHIDGWTVLFANDAGFNTERSLSRSGFDLKSDVLVTGKHASDHSSTYQFLRAVSPEILIASNSRYPVAQSREAGWESATEGNTAHVFEQDAHGAVTLRISPGSITATGYVSGKSVRIHR